MAMRRVDDDDIDPTAHQLGHAFMAIRGEADRRADGILLEAMIENQPKSDLIAKVVRGLLAGETLAERIGRGRRMCAARAAS